MELQSIETFLADAEAALKKSKAGKQRKEALRKAIDELRYQPDMEHVIRVKDQTLELYLYGDVAQYLYNVGYPLPRDDNSMLENIAPRKDDSGKIIRLFIRNRKRVLFTVEYLKLIKIIQKISSIRCRRYIILHGIMNCVKLSFHCRLIRNRESVFMCLRGIFADLGMEHRVSKSTAGKDCGNSGRKPLLLRNYLFSKYQRI